MSYFEDVAVEEEYRRHEEEEEEPLSYLQKHLLAVIVLHLAGMAFQYTALTAPQFPYDFEVRRDAAPVQDLCTHAHTNTHTTCTYTIYIYTHTVPVCHETPSF